jgi:hypothetical protein
MEDVVVEEMGRLVVSELEVKKMMSFAAKVLTPEKTPAVDAVKVLSALCWREPTVRGDW